LSGPSGAPAALSGDRFIQQQQIRVNGRIRAREVRVILGTTNEQLGIMKLTDALRRAQSLGLDLVEVAPTANPPVCKIVDFGKYRYDLAKQEKDRRSTASKLKEIKSNPDNADETKATFNADANIPYDIVIATLDAMRQADDGKILFPDVNFAAGIQ